MLDALRTSVLGSGRGFLLLIDITNAFGSTPVALVILLLKKLGLPSEIINLCQANFQMTRVFNMDGQK